MEVKEILIIVGLLIFAIMAAVLVNGEIPSMDIPSIDIRNIFEEPKEATPPISEPEEITNDTQIMWNATDIHERSTENATVVEYYYEGSGGDGWGQITNGTPTTLIIYAGGGGGGGASSYNGATVTLVPV